METVVIRHPKERLRKCSLRGLECRENMTFYKATSGFSFDASGCILLGLDAPELSEEDAGKTLLLLDSTWTLLPKVEACVTGNPIRRTLPEIQTAYPRVSKLTDDPQHGLASVEALYLACRLMGHDDPTMLDDYYWKDLFLERVGEYFKSKT